jgi:DNA helicase-2/ATP-dependent DNA helicase PcrA
MGARLQHEEPRFAADPADRQFEDALVGWLRFHAGMLIGEIIPQLYEYLRNNPAAPERNLYDFVLVDEYQDLNRAEQRVIDLLSENAHLCIVGDDDQSLYSFKYAHPAGIRTFPAEHPGVTDHEILNCRRCPTRVVRIANALISRNRDRDARELTPMPANGPGQVRIVQYDSLQEEAAGVAAFVHDHLTNHGRQPADILVLAQRRSIGNPIHDALSARDIPSKSYYQEGVLDSISAQERLALLKLLLDRQDRIALRWLLGYGSDNFRHNPYARIRVACEQMGLTPWDLLSQLADGELVLPHVNHLVRRFEEIRAALSDLRDYAAQLTNFIDVWMPDTIEELDDFRMLVADLAPLAGSPEELLSLIMESVTQPEIPPDVVQVRIMSLHKSKGLSSSVVVIAGCIEGLLPAAPDPDHTPEEQRAGLEEQRRLLYVGITRVKSQPATKHPGVLLLTSSRSMTLADAMRSGITPAGVRYDRAYVHTSRFIGELGPAAPAPERG